MIWIDNGKCVPKVFACAKFCSSRGNQKSEQLQMRCEVKSASARESADTAHQPKIRIDFATQHPRRIITTHLTFHQ